MKQAVPSISFCLGQWHVNRAFTERRIMKRLDSLCYSVCYIKWYEQGWQSLAMSSDWTAFYCIGIIRSCCVLSVMSGLSCINEGLAVIKESVSQNEWDENRCWQEFARRDSVWLRGAGEAWGERWYFDLKGKLKNKLLKCSLRTFQNKWTI